MRNVRIYKVLLFFAMFSVCTIVSGAATLTFDVMNYYQNLKQTWNDITDEVNQVKQIYYQIKNVNNQFEMMKAQAKQLEHSAKNIKGLDFDSFELFFESFGELEKIANNMSSLLTQSDKLTRDIREIYPDFNIDDLLGHGERDKILKDLVKNRNAIAKVYDTAGLSKNIKKERALLNTYMNEAKNAQGELAVQQAQAQISGMILKNINGLKLLSSASIDLAALRFAEKEKARLRRIRLTKELAVISNRSKGRHGFSTLPRLR